MRSILAQSALQGGRFLVLDPHYGAGEESLAASFQPLQALMMAEPAASDAQMREIIGEVWGATGGDSYRRASTEYQAIVRQLIR